MVALTHYDFIIVVASLQQYQLHFFVLLYIYWNTESKPKSAKAGKKKAGSAKHNYKPTSTINLSSKTGSKQPPATQDPLRDTLEVVDSPPTAVAAAAATEEGSTGCKVEESSPSGEGGGEERPGDGEVVEEQKDCTETQTVN